MKDYTLKFENTLREVKLLIDRFGQDYHVVEAYVYGSYANNTHGSKSDLDIFLVIDTDYCRDSNNKRSIRNFIHNILYNPDIMEVEVDVHVAPADDWEQDNSNILIDQVRRKVRLIWQRS